MKRKVDAENDGNYEEQPVKRRCQDSSPNAELKKQFQPQQPPSPLSQDFENQLSSCEQTTNEHASWEPSSEVDKRIWDWIPTVDPLEVVELGDMSQPSSKRSRSASTDRGRRRSVSSDDAKSSAYKDVNYVPILEQKSCFMHPSSAGLNPEDISLCERLLNQPNDVPTDTLLDDEYIEAFRIALQGRSEARVTIHLHPLLMPSAENRHIRGGEGLENVIDSYNDPWYKTEPIHGPKPQPDHAWGLKPSTFSEQQRRKLGIKTDAKSMYAVREDMYFPYFAAEIKCGNQALDFADRQNMHSMCIALRAVVSLAQAAECLEQVNRRILGFSISHDSEDVRIYAYYPEINEDKIQYYRRPLKRYNIWSKDERWACFRFVENVNRQFLPIHIKRLNDLLGEINDVQDIYFESEDEHEVASQASGSRGRSFSSYASQNRGHAELRSMIQQLLQQNKEQQVREEKLLAQMEKQRAEQREREEKLLARMEEQSAEHKAREEKLLAQMEKQRAEQREREEKLLARMEEQSAEHKAREENLLQLLTTMQHDKQLK